ncbi:DUF6282 family protein [Deinococcus alpinitundrae]|uniref:DUF6282 family protein n=1 Tax=Deinococcus alpinitundrae TaxID=468913 RepID=UPI00137AA049|nr:DUF6282 family protein [Deinococcus alpinitundrae]
MTTTDHPTPSREALDLTRGAFDLHIHIDPDVIRRRVTDLELAPRFLERGLRGFVLKSHYTSTAERAAVVRAAVPGIKALGSLTLNSAVGGLNPLAVEIAAREGARIIWLPTVDAENEEKEHASRPAGAKLPLWAKLQEDLRARGLPVPSVPVVDGKGEVLHALRQVLQVVATHGLVLATGHLSRNEIFKVVAAACEEGVEHIVVTHPDYPTQNLSVADQLELAHMGAWMERCAAPSYSGKVAWERLFEATRAVGPERTIFSTDFGQPANPPVEDGLPIMVDQFLRAGFSEQDLHCMTVTNSVLLAGAAVKA